MLIGPPQLKEKLRDLALIGPQIADLTRQAADLTRQAADLRNEIKEIVVGMVDSPIIVVDDNKRIWTISFSTKEVTCTYTDATLLLEPSK